MTTVYTFPLLNAVLTYTCAATSMTLLLCAEARLRLPKVALHAFQRGALRFLFFHTCLAYRLLVRPVPLMRVELFFE